MTNPYFSVIIPCLNEEKYLPKLLKNLEKQNFTDFETIIVDGKSTDKTIKEVKKFSKSLNLKIETSTKRNVSYQRNLGANTSKGDILIFFDADTKIPKSFLKNIKQLFDTENPDVVNTWVKTSSRLEKDKAIAVGMNALFEVTKFIGSPSCFGAFLAIKKGAFKKVKGFDEELKFAEDSELLQRLVKDGFKYLIAKNIYYYYSLRRFKKEGTLNVIRKTAILNLNRSLKLEKFLNIPDYQMGGHIFENINEKNTLLTLNQIIDTARENYKKNISENKKFLKKLFEEFK